MGPTASSHPTPQLAEPPPAGVARPLGSAPLDWPATGRHAGDTARAISTQIVALVREHTGRAPTKAKAIISPDLVVVSLADCLTTAERHVAAAGHSELITHTREALHQGMEAEARRSSKSSRTSRSPPISPLNTTTPTSPSSSSTSPRSYLTPRESGTDAPHLA